MIKRIGIIGEFNEAFAPHLATNEALNHSKTALKSDIEFDWISTNEILSDLDKIKENYTGFWIAPGSPYKNMMAALTLIEHARSNNIPTLGTCGGFQHMVIEYARNVMGIEDAEHAEYDPYASSLVVNHLTCSLAGQELRIKILDRVSKVFSLYDQNEASEKYYCNFGLNRQYQKDMHQAGFLVVGSDDTGEARILELPGHPFFIATLFVPQNSSTANKPHPIINGFVKTINAL